MAEKSKPTNNQTEAQIQQALTKIPPKVAEGPVRTAELINGEIHISGKKAAVKYVDVADVDLLVTLETGEKVIVPNGAIDALVNPNTAASFADGNSSLYDLFKMTGSSHAAKAGSLRIVTDNIDANPPEASDANTSTNSNIAPPAPLIKTGAGSGTGNGNGAAKEQPEIPQEFIPPVVATPTVFSAARKSISSEELKNLTGSGTPNISAELYTASEYKITPTGVSALPSGAYDPNATADQLAERASAQGQSAVDKIYGTSGNDTFDFNSAFSTGENLWLKTLHVTLNNFASVSSIEIVFDANKIVNIPGFNIVGEGVTRNSPTSNTWTIAPSSDMLANGLDLNIVYNVANNVTPVNFAADLVVKGKSGILLYELTKNLLFTWRDASNLDDFTVLNDTGSTLAVLPSGGQGLEIFANEGDDVVYAGAGHDIIHGGQGNDLIIAGAGNDLLEGGAGADAMQGGTGNDTSAYENSSIGIVANLDSSLSVSNTGEATGDTYFSIENLKGSRFNDTLIGNNQNNTLTGGEGNDILIGGAGADILDGGDGTDTASYIYSTTSVTVDLKNKRGTAGDANGDTLNAIENLVGGQANDTFISGDGLVANTFDGQAGQDTVSYALSSTNITASLTTGFSDVLQTNNAQGDVYINIENLTGSAFDDTLIGNASHNILIGNAGNDTLEGLGGADQFIGGTGLDTASYAHSALGVVASLSTSFSTGPTVTITNDAAGDTYIDIEHLTGTNFNDTLIGDNNRNTLMGSEGDDVLEGMADADTLDGGLGSDTASYAHATSAIAVSLTTGLSGFIALGDGIGDTFTSIENITGSNFNDLLIGNTDTNRLEGGTGDDILEGMGGADTLIGGTGNNTASYARAADLGTGLGLTVSLADASLNTGDAFGDTYTNIQNLTGSNFNDTLTGDTNNNILTGGLGNDTLTGGAGTDTLNGGEGNDLLIDDLAGSATINGGDGDDIIRITNRDNQSDTISGGNGVDTLEFNTQNNDHMFVDLRNNNEVEQIHNFQIHIGLISGFENVSAFGATRLYVNMSNADNVIRGTSTSTDDFVLYNKAIAGINLNLNTGVVTGGSGNDMLFNIDSVDYGSHFNDVLIGNAGNNRLNGGRGADLIDGGAGIDSVFYHQNETEAITVSLMNTAINSALGIQFTSMAKGDVLVSIEQLYGSVFSDTLYGNSGNNTLWGNNGNDILEGMAGADALDGMNDNDTASYANAGLAAASSETTAQGLGVVASLTTSFSVGPAVTTSGDAAGDTYSNIENLLGSSFDDTLIGNSGVNILTGGAGNDILEGLGGGDTFSGGAGIDTVTYIHSTLGVVADLSGTLVGTNDALNDTFTGVENLTGTNFNDSLYGNSNDNILDGGLGSNFLDGGVGVDTASYLSSTGAVTINLDTNSVSGGGRSDILANIERVIGSNFVDTITGTGGNDWIDGGLGADNLDGGTGIDTISYNSATGGISITLGGANSQGDTLNSFENVYGSSFGDLITGDGGDNTLEGGLGNDTLNGGGGTNTVSYSAASAAVQVNISSSAVAGIAANSASGGADTDTLSNFTHITGSNHNDTLIGDNNANTLNGGAGNDTLVGGVGGDTLMGGTGIDTASYVNASSAIAVTINSTGTLGDANGDTLNGIENIIGSAFDDTITGDGVNNLIEGGLGNDTINGQGGTDTASYATAASAVTINISNAGVNASGGAGNDTLTNIENIIGSAFADNITGDGGNNTLEGGLGNDILNGGAGIDTVSYINASAGVNVNISASSLLSVAANSASGGDGADTLSNFENIIGSAFNDILIGNGSNNSFDGGAGNDLFVGGAGADAFIGDLGIDTVSYVNASSGVNMTLDNTLAQTNDAAGDTFLSIENIIGTAFGDNLYGDNTDNTIVGGQGNDVLAGRDGNDILDISEGRDTAYGDNGDDTFIVNVASNNTPGYIHGGNDLNSFNLGGDTIRLTGLTSGQNYSLSTIANVTDFVEIVDIRDTINSTLTLGSNDVQNIMNQGNGANLFIKADSGDTLNLSLNADQTVQTFNVHNGTSYVIYTGSTQVAAVHWQTA